MGRHRVKSLANMDGRADGGVLCIETAAGRKWRNGPLRRSSVTRTALASVMSLTTCDVRPRPGSMEGARRCHLAGSTKAIPLRRATMGLAEFATVDYRKGLKGAHRRPSCSHIPCQRHCPMMSCPLEISVAPRASVPTHRQVGGVTEAMRRGRSRAKTLVTALASPCVDVFPNYSIDGTSHE